MTQSLLMLRLTACLFLMLSRSLFALEVREAVVNGSGDDISRTYQLFTGDKPDQRFKFTAQKASGNFWDLSILPTDISDWAGKLSFEEYTDVIYRCVDRFVTDVPDAQVLTIDVCITRDSKTWQAIRKLLVSKMKERTGPAVAFSGLDHGYAAAALGSSPEIEQIAQHLAKRLRRNFNFTSLDMDYLIMRITTREESQRTWQEIAKLPDLALDMSSLKFSLDFKPRDKADGK